MPTIQEFVQSAAARIGASEPATQSAAGAILQVLRERADGNDFDNLLQKLPGASKLLSETSSSAEEGAGGGLLGGLAGSLAGGLGGSGSAAGVLVLLQKSGLGSDKLGALIPLFIQFAKSEAGEALVERLVGQVPELKKLMG